MGKPFIEHEASAEIAMPSFWFTQHWPHPIERQYDFPWFVYVQDKYKHMAEPMERGDQIVFYETDSAKKHLDSSGQPIELHRGRKAVVMIATVSGPIRERTAPEPVKAYEDGEVLDWKWEVPCIGHKEGVPVPLDQVQQILRRQGMLIRGGVLAIDQLQYQRFAKALGIKA